MEYQRRDEGFLALGAYMDGKNEEGAAMAQTQPVIMRYEKVGGGLVANGRWWCVMLWASRGLWSMAGGEA